MNQRKTRHRILYFCLLSLPAAVLLIEFALLLRSVHNLPSHVALRCSPYQGGSLTDIALSHAIGLLVIASTIVASLTLRSYREQPGLHVAAFVAFQGMLVTPVYRVMRCNTGGRWQEIDYLIGMCLWAFLAWMVGMLALKLKNEVKTR
jgi:hypothetical protein